MSDMLRGILSRDLDFNVKQHFERTSDAMTRELHYLHQRNNRYLQSALKAGWTLERVKVLIVLNSFHRVVLGPLEAAYMTPTKSGLGGRVSITYGTSLTVGDRDGVDVRDALSSFDAIMKGLRIRSHWLNIGRVSDLLFAIGKQDVDKQ